jgi:hypothetical protein
MVVEPTMQSTQPTIPRVCNRSLRTTCANAALHFALHPTHMPPVKNLSLSLSLSLSLHEPKPGTTKDSTYSLADLKIPTYLTMMLNAPRGVTRTAGANA